MLLVHHDTQCWQYCASVRLHSRAVLSSRPCGSICTQVFMRRQVNVVRCCDVLCCNVLCCDVLCFDVLCCSTCT